MCYTRWEIPNFAIFRVMIAIMLLLNIQVTYVLEIDFFFLYISGVPLAQYRLHIQEKWICTCLSGKDLWDKVFKLPRLPPFFYLFFSFSFFGSLLTTETQAAHRIEVENEKRSESCWVKTRNQIGTQSVLLSTTQHLAWVAFTRTLQLRIDFDRMEFPILLRPNIICWQCKWGLSRQSHLNDS